MKEAAKLLGVCTGTVSRWADKGKLRDNKKKGKGRQVTKSSVLLLKQNREDQDRRKDGEEVLQDIANRIPDMH